MKEKLFYPLILIIIFLVILLFAQGFSSQNITINKSSGQKFQENQKESFVEQKFSDENILVAKAIDGDTIELENGQKVRYIGIDTPETVDPRHSVQCYGREAANKNKELVEGKKVKLEKDVSETDRYGRLLRYVYVGKIFVNEYLVREGFAKASSYPPNIKYQEKFQEAESSARTNKKGFWSSCSVTSGQVQSSANYSLTPLNNAAECKIKGNISSSGEKIYHVPGGAYYDKTSIDESKGERWFCSEQEAQSFGWRASKL